MKLPKFKYSPNAYKLDIFKTEDGICSVCNNKSNLKYTGSFYSIDEPEYICPWCIANGKAAEKYDGEFNDYCGIETVSPDPNDTKCSIPEELLLEVTNKTPSYNSCQQEEWLTHCNEPCAFLAYADGKRIEPLIEELKEDIENNLGAEIDYVTNNLTTDGSFVGYLFRCVKCGKHRLHADYD